jgi:hypothetical protein
MRLEGALLLASLILIEYLSLHRFDLLFLFLLPLDVLPDPFFVQSN